MTCHLARQLLAAYRRDDWTSDEMRALAGHLAMCAACRQVEAAYRQVGESVRMLPTITPDPTLRETVFAAVAAERRKFSPAEIIASRAETEPSLPVVRAPVRQLPRRRTLGPAGRAAMGIAAALVLALFALQLVPGFNLSDLATSIFHGASETNAAARIATYTPTAQGQRITNLRATSQWVAYTSGAQLFVIDRAASKTRIIAASSAGPITIRALTAHWVVWSDTASGWTVYASPLTGATGHVYTVASAASAQGAGNELTGVWANDGQALIAVASPGASGTILSARLDGSAAPKVAARAAHPNAVIVRPAMVGNTAVWEELWTASGALHGAAHGVAVSGPRDLVFGLSDNGATVLWVSPDQAPAISSADPAALVAAEARASGQLFSQRSGQLRQIDSQAIAGSAQLDHLVALWSDGSAYRILDVQDNSAEPVTAQLSAAHQADANAGMVSWYDGAHISVYTE